MNTPKQKDGQEKIYQFVTERIIAALEKGVIPWRKSWSGGDSAPVNYKSKKEYRGVNVLMLLCSGYVSPKWLTFKQAVEAGGRVIAGEKGTPVVFWNFIEKPTDEPGRTRKIPFLKYYTVFNLSQCEGIEDTAAPVEPVKPFEQIERAVRIVGGMPNPPTVTGGASRAAYRPSTDTVIMPQGCNFDSEPEYYSTLFHELVHSTGHKSRLDREGVAGGGFYGSQLYSKEELVAEMGAAFLCAEAGISNEVIDNQAAYIDGWLSQLRKDRKLLIQAAGKAQLAADYILNRKYEAQ
jgi:antirestriction protein ArdC